MLSAPPGVAWPDLLEALRFAEARFGRWHEEGALSDEQIKAIRTFYAGRRERWLEESASGRPAPDDLGLPPPQPHESAAARAKRFLMFVDAEAQRHQRADFATLAQLHRFRTEIRERLRALERREPEDAPEVLPSRDPAAPRRPLVELLLDPRNILWLLAFGGALMVTGLVILLRVNDWFTPPVVALTMGLGNVALLLAGWAVIRYSRYQTAGRALTLLACLVMPLNLWYYHAHGIRPLTVEQHLWVAALVICGLYAASAWILRDELFVYVLTEGVTLTGLLILANQQHFEEIAAPSTLLVVLGLLAIHAERIFPERQGPFSRQRFGPSFFWSGHALLAAGLLLLLGAQLAANWLYEPLFRHLYESRHLDRTPIVLTDWGRWLAVCLVVLGTYAYLYSDLVVRRVGVFFDLAAATVVWAEILTLEALQVPMRTDVLIAVLASTSLAANLVHASGAGRGRMTQSLPTLGLFLGFLAVLLGSAAYLRALNPDLQHVWQSEKPTWGYVGAMLLTAAAFRAGALLNRSAQRPLLVGYAFGAAAAFMVGAVAFLAALGLTQWQQHAPWLMLVPIAYLAAARIARGSLEEDRLAWVAHAAAAIMLVSSLASAFHGFTHIVERQSLNLALASFFAEAAVFYGLAGAWRREGLSIHLCSVAACAAVWQLLTYMGVPAEAYTLTFSFVGLVLLIVYRLAMLDRFTGGAVASRAFESGNTLLTLGLVASVLLGISRIASQQLHPGQAILKPSFVALSGAVALISLLAVALVRHADWRRAHVVMAVSQASVVLFALQLLSRLTPLQKLEIFSVVVGAALLALGHVGWYREDERHNELVSVSLLLGSLLAGVPLAIATLVDRWHDQFIILNELGFLIVSVLLLASGMVLRLRSTTLTGGTLTALYFIMLLVFVPWSRLNAVAIIITSGGAMIFGTGLLLSLFRDRLLALPDRIQRREGLFQVLGWR